MPGSLQARFSMLLAFDDAHGHAARPHIPFDLTSAVSAGLPGISAEHFPRLFRRVESEPRASRKDTQIRSPSLSMAGWEIAL
jgi:hypothetical protein